MVKQETIVGPFQELHLPSSRWTESQIVRAERRIILNSTTIHQRNQSNKYDLGCDAWTPHRRLLEYRRYMVLGGGWRRNKRHERPDYLWPEIWKDVSEAAQRKEKQKWATEKPKLDNARRLRGISFIDPADAEFKEIINNARRKLEVPMPAAMPCKIRSGK